MTKTLIKNVIDTINKIDNQVFFSPTNYQIEFDMEEIIYNNKVLVGSGKEVGYIGDSLANDEIVNLMKKLFADYKYNIQREDVLKNVLGILDCFAEIGSKSAIDLFGG